MSFSKRAFSSATASVLDCDSLAKLKSELKTHLLTLTYQDFCQCFWSYGTIQNCILLLLCKAQCSRNGLHFSH